MKITTHIGWLGIATSLCAAARGAWDARELVQEPGIIHSGWFWVLAVLLFSFSSIPGVVGSWALRNPTTRRAEISLWVSGLFFVSFLFSFMRLERLGIEARMFVALVSWVVAIAILLRLMQRIKNES
jgi:hypothetical protein